MNKIKASSQLESLLGLSLPRDYREFIDKTGYLGLGNISTEVYGYRPDFDIRKIPCVIAATKLNREDYKLQNQEVVISHTGFEDYTHCVFPLTLRQHKNKMKIIVFGILRYIPILTLLASVTLTIAGCSTDEINKGIYEGLSELQTKGMNRTAEYECSHVSQGEAEMCKSRYKKIYEEEYNKH